MILIISDEFDLHADVVAKKLVDAGCGYFRLNLDAPSLKRTYVTHSNGCGLIQTPVGSISSRVVSCIWCRRSSVSLNLEEQSDHSNGFRLWKSEWNRCLFGLYNALADKPWVNGIRSATLSDNKFYQFSIAEQCGLSIPDLITSNKKEDLIDFAKKYKSVALKFMAQDMYELPDGSLGGLYVNRITHEDLSEFEEYSENPITLQAYVDKEFEVRYTVVGEEHMACRIESQSSAVSSVDWRRYDIPNTPHVKMESDNKICIMVNLLMSRLNLSFGALDFIVDKSGKWWFLEVNSTGQWLWIEDLAGIDISGSISRYLIRKSTENRHESLRT